VSDAEPAPSARSSAELTSALNLVTIHSPLVFSLAGEAPIDVSAIPTTEGWAGGGPSGSAQPADHERLVRAIQTTLYDRGYARRLGGSEYHPTRAVAADPEFVRRLAEANSTRERWDQGWIVHHLGPDGQVFVRKGERERAAIPGAFISEAVVGAPPQIGASVRIRAPRETLDMQPGYYFAFGETLDELAEQSSLVRLYFHCDAEGAVRLVGGLSREMNEFQVPFKLKVPAAPSLCDRTDAAVLYIGARYFAITARIVAQVHEDVPLAPAVPLFTKRLWPGIGAAVDPGSGESFGTHRCRLAAEGIVDAWQQGSQELTARLAAVAARFATAGLDLARPYVGPGGIDIFEAPEPPRLP
jgi:hypothetical protein